jgi:hypothetical protein
MAEVVGHTETTLIFTHLPGNPAMLPVD